jgi:ArsR family transcriptional regulator
MSLPQCTPSDHARSSRLAEVDPEALDRAAGIFRALGEPGRLRVLALLSQKSMCVTELAETLGESVSTVSQRLKLLRSERLAQSRRDGKHIYYALADQHIVELVINGFDHAAHTNNHGSKVRGKRAKLNHSVRATTGHKASR